MQEVNQFLDKIEARAEFVLDRCNRDSGVARKSVVATRGFSQEQLAKRVCDTIDNIAIVRNRLDHSQRHHSFERFEDSAELVLALLRAQASLPESTVQSIDRKVRGPTYTDEHREFWILEYRRISAKCLSHRIKPNSEILAAVAKAHAEKFKEHQPNCSTIDKFLRREGVIFRKSRKKTKNPKL